jgi:hypothetical protein
MKKSARSIKRFIAAHPVLITAGITVGVFLLLMKRNAGQLDNFLAERGLTEEYQKWLTEIED